MSTNRKTYRRSIRRQAALLGLVGLYVLAGCGDDAAEEGNRATSPSTATSSAPSAGTERETPVPSSPREPSSWSSSAPSPPTGCEGGDVVDVADAEALQRALDDATAGTVIHLADGRYEGTFTATATARPDSPIRLCGGRGAILDGGDVEDGYTLHLSGASYWHLLGFTVTGGQKGVMVDNGVGHRIEDLLVTSVGDEAIHLRTHSTDNVVIGNTIRDTGLRKPKFGEGIYVGSANSNWCQITDCEPDRSDRNLIQANDIAGTTAEAVDIKEGTSDGVVRDNVFDGEALDAVDSWVDVKGNGWTVAGNSGTTSPGDGFQVHEAVDGWGRDTIFSGNTATGVKGYALNVAGPREMRNSTTVSCDNRAEGAPEGLSNVPCGGP
jgi:nitrous oxidase accessory protein NosD